MDHGPAMTVATSLLQSPIFTNMWSLNMCHLVTIVSIVKNSAHQGMP